MLEIDISIVIVTYNTEQITYNCIQSVIDSETKYNFEVILVDNNSADKTVERITSDFPQVNVIASPENLGFSKGNNLGIQHSSGKYILLLNSDTILFQSSLNDLLQVATDKNYDICGPTLLNADHSIQRSWFNFPSGLKIFLRLTDAYLLLYKLSTSWMFKLFYSGRKPAFMVSEIKSDIVMDYLTFACILIKRTVIEKIGALDEGLFFYQEDCEYGLRAKKNGYFFNYTVSSKIIHLGGSSSSKFSLMAFQNDILGLLHIYKKHYTPAKFKQVRNLIYLALQIRIAGTYFGLFNGLKKSGLYDRSEEGGAPKQQLRNSYIELKNIVKNYN